MKKVTAIIVNWNGVRDTLDCLASLSKIIIPHGYIFTVIVVDNGSNDGSATKIKKLYPDIEAIELSDNSGYTGGNNIGITHALSDAADIIWLLNNDTIVDKHVLNALNVFENPHIGIAGSKIYFMQGHEFHKYRYKKNDLGNIIWYAGGLIDWENMYASHRGVDEVDAGQYDDIQQTDFITGCSMFIHSTTVKKIGLFDEKYYLYLEDLDYSIRAKRADFELTYCPQSVVWHSNAGSAGGSGSRLQEYYMTRNRMLIGAKYASLRAKTALFREAMRMLLTGNNTQKKAIADFFMGKFGNRYE